MPDLTADNLHPYQLLITPEGEHVPIDVELVPLIQCLWGLGVTTSGCCQDLGESIIVGNSPSRERHAAFYRGQAWLKMPRDDGITLLNLLAARPEYAERLTRWTHPDAWSAFVYLEPDDDGTTLSEWAQIHFPRDQIPEITEALRSLRPQPS